MSEPLSRPICLLVPAFVLGLLAVGVGEARADFQNWSTQHGASRISLEAELVRFDFANKEIICRDRKGTEHRLPTIDLDTRSRAQLLFSAAFIRSYPTESFSREQGALILLAVGLPAAFLLAGFFLGAMVVMKSFNPLRAVIGWVGSVVLGAFLISFYVMLSNRSPEAATGISIFGFLVVSGLLSLYVSIIYRTTLWKAFKLLLLHFIVAISLMAVAVGILKLGLDPEQAAEILENNVFKPVGLV